MTFGIPSNRLAKMYFFARTIVRFNIKIRRKIIEKKSLFKTTVVDKTKRHYEQSTVTEDLFHFWNDKFGLCPNHTDVAYFIIWLSVTNTLLL